MDRFEGRRIRWGLLGGGKIIDRWMKGALQCEDMEVVAVASRTRKTAEAMADKWQIPRVMTLDEMCSCPEIDAVYIPVPHSAHKELALRAMRAGKAVLVEKPAAVSEKEFDEMVLCARECGVFMMEAAWTRFFPAVEQLCELLREGVIGRVRAVQAAFAFRMDGEWDGRLFDPARAGGGLLDVGVYPLHFAQALFGRAPEGITGFCARDTDDRHIMVDEQAAFTAVYDQGELMMGACGVRTQIPDNAYIYGEDGWFEVPEFWKAQKLIFHKGEETRVFDCPVSQTVPGMEDEGYQYEIRHMNECLRGGLTESPVVPFSATKCVLAQCDELRRQWGLVYPFEK